MPPAAASSKKATKVLITRPPIVHIPKAVCNPMSHLVFYARSKTYCVQMLAKKQLRKNDQPDSQFLSLPSEIVVSIIKQPALDVFDRACLMLTCKGLAALMTGFNLGTTLKTRFKSGKEEERLEHQQSMIDLEDSEQGEYAAYYDMLEYEFEQRIDPERFFDFLARLDAGWNQSKTRLCGECNSFQPTSNVYWAKKAQKYWYKLDNPAARGYRIMEDCRCGCNPVATIKKWVEYKDKPANRLTRCPDCIFKATREDGPFCTSCSQFEDDFACGCSGCVCERTSLFD